MATKVYLRKTSALAGVGWGGVTVNDPDGSRIGIIWGLSTSPGAGLATQTAGTVAGPVSGRGLGWFISPPLAAAVTISGTITYNLWGLESAMAANTGFQGVIKRVDNTGAVGGTNVSNKEFGTELATTTAAVNNWTDAAPTSTAFSIGDRILLAVCINDAGGTMGSGATITLDLDGATGGADGDSWVQFNEAISFMSAPAGSTYYLTDTASDVSGSGKKAASTSRGAGSTNSATTQVNGPVSPTQVTDTAGGTALEWYTPQLNAFTLSGMAQFNVRAKAALAGTAEAVGAEIAVCNSDGSGASVWGYFGQADRSAGSGGMALASASDVANLIYVSGTDTAVSSGQRLRLRVYLDDCALANTLATHSPLTVTYSGVSSGAAGDTFVVLPQTVTEAVTTFSFPPIPQMIPNLINR